MALLKRTGTTLLMTHAATCLALMLLGMVATAKPAQAGVGCPLTYKGRPLADVGLFEGDPVDKVEIMSANGGFVLPRVPSVLWPKHPYYSLGCRYRGLEELVPVRLPQRIVVCEFDPYPKTNCR